MPDVTTCPRAGCPFAGRPLWASHGTCPACGTRLVRSPAPPPPDPTRRRPESVRRDVVHGQAVAPLRRGPRRTP